MLETIKPKGAAIIAANHLSFLDSFFIPLVIKRRKMTYLAKADYFKSWKTSWFFKSVGQISCEREGGKKSQQSLEIALDVLVAAHGAPPPRSIARPAPQGRCRRDGSVAVRARAARGAA